MYMNLGIRGIETVFIILQGILDKFEELSFLVQAKYFDTKTIKILNSICFRRNAVNYLQ